MERGDHSPRSNLVQDLYFKWLEREAVTGVQQLRAVANGQDLRHERPKDDEIVLLCFRLTDLPAPVAVVRNIHKDVEHRVGIPGPALVAQRVEGLVATGGGDLDYAAIATVIFKLAGVN